MSTAPLDPPVSAPGDSVASAPPPGASAASAPPPGASAASASASAPGPAKAPAPRVPLTDSRAFAPAVIVATLLAAMLVAVATAATQGSLAVAILRAALVVVLVPCAVIDIERRIIPNRITYPAALVAVLLGLALDAGHEPRRLMWAGIAGGFLLLAALVNPAGMGMGDVKLLFVMGLFLGRPVVVALFLALLGPVFAGVFLARRKGVKAARKSALPFGPYLALGGLVAALAGDPLLNAYLSLRH